MTSVTATSASKSKAPSTPLSLIHRLEGASLAAAAVLFFIVAGFAWWWLIALFLVFDLSALGYLVSNRAGSRGYNLVHNYFAPAILFAAYGALIAFGITVWPLAFVAGCWFFHVGLDRALGYGPRPSV